MQQLNARAGSKLKNFDLYGKVHDDYRIKTQSGGIISLVSMLIMAMLFLSELHNYLRAELIDHIVVDTTLNQKLPIGLNITFPHIRCDEVSVDTVDSKGENQVDIAGTLTKMNLDVVGAPSKGDPVAKPGECFSCLEAQDLAEKGEKLCCNSCQALKETYQDFGLPYFHILDTAMQCSNSVGCRVEGDVLVSKVGGNVHVALGKSTVRDGKHVHEFNLKDVEDGFNTSHIIHRLEFGERVPGVESPLEGTAKIVLKGAYMFHYYIKLVPTLFEGDGKSQYTHQYSVTGQEKDVLVRKGELAGLPGVFLVYEFTPFMVQKSVKEVPFSHFVISVCAIIGGVFTDRLLIFSDFLNSSDIPKLFKAVDGFILPTHGEGWGLPLIEAMASGIPTISTGWGGQMDFMNDENSWPVSYDLVESPTMGARWAQPRKDALVKACWKGPAAPLVPDTPAPRPRRLRAWGRRVKRRVRGCLGLQRHELCVHPAVVPVIDRKKTASVSGGHRTYKGLVAEAEAGGVPAAVIHQIQLDVSRTFPAIPSCNGQWGWPEEISDAEREGCLARVLMAFECRALDSLGPRPPERRVPGLPMLLKIRRSWCGQTDSGNGSTNAAACERAPLAPMRHSVGGEGTAQWSRTDMSIPQVGDPVPTYVQGCSMMAAMCLGFTAGREEEGFWLFAYLMEDILGPDFFSRRPAMLGYHGDKAALAQLVASTMPQLAERVGTTGLAECVSALAARCLLSGFVGFLSGEPLVALWEELLTSPWVDYPRLPLLLWFTGLVQHAERQLQEAPGDELVPNFFRTVQAASSDLPNGWRPVLPLSVERARELQQLSSAAAEKYREMQEEIHCKEMHAKQVSASLDRSTARLADALKMAENLSGAQGSDLAMHEVVRGGDVVREKVERGCAEVHQKYQINVVANRAVELMIGIRGLPVGFATETMLECFGGIFKKGVKLPVKPGKVPIYVMLQLDWLADDGQSLRYKEVLHRQLAAAKTAGIKGVMAREPNSLPELCLDAEMLVLNYTWDG
eukprot:symbB.v1.2.023644.t3/scaffold2178.1/size86794/7